MPMIILPLYDASGCDLDDANARVLDMVSEAFGLPVTYPAQIAAHAAESGAIDAMPGLAVEFIGGTDSASTRGMVHTIARRYAAETGVSRIIYFRDSHTSEVLEIRGPAALTARAA
jgi:hypothetical protein